MLYQNFDSMKFRTPYNNYDPSPISSLGGESLVREDQALTVRQIVDMYTAGEDISGHFVDSQYDYETTYDSDGNIDEDFLADIIVDPVNTLSLDESEIRMLIDNLAAWERENPTPPDADEGSLEPVSGTQLPDTVIDPPGEAGVAESG